jgi:medium-chain acyl-[acyl-carrier-protein] hydrolase
MNPIWENTFKITAFDVDANNRLRINRIFDYFQDAASNDAERLGFGYKDFVPQGLFWVLSWVKIELLDYPKFVDETKIQTWGKKQHKLYSMRDFLMFNSKDEIIIRGTSAWLLLDSKSLRPKILTQLFPQFKMLDTKDALPDLPQKINSVKEMEMVYIKKIRYSDIDLNQHTNNAKYVELLLDCFDYNFHKNHCIKSLIISFSAETRFGEEIELYKGNLNPNAPSHYIEAKNKINSNSVFNAAVEWY